MFITFRIENFVVKIIFMYVIYLYEIKQLLFFNRKLFFNKNIYFPFKGLDTLGWKEDSSGSDELEQNEGILQGRHYPMDLKLAEARYFIRSKL